MEIVKKTLLGLGTMVLVTLVSGLLKLLPKRILLILNITSKTIAFLVFAYCVGVLITELK